jgi:hypothetical protein
VAADPQPGFADRRARALDPIDLERKWGSR